MFTEIFTRLVGYFLPGRPDFHLSSSEREHVLLVSFLPFVVVGILLLNLYIDVEQIDRFGGFGNGTSDVWVRLSTTLNALSFFLPGLAVGVMFLTGIQAVSRSEGSWYLLFASLLALLALGFGFTGSGMFLVRDPNSESFWELRAYTWVNWATTFSFLIAGFGFLAYRGLGATEPWAGGEMEDEDDEDSAVSEY